VVLPLRKDAVETREVALRGPSAIRLRPQYPVYQRAKTCHRPPLHQVIHPLGEVGSIGKIDAGNAADGLCGVGHVTNITWNGGYGDGVTANSEQRTANGEPRSFDFVPPPFGRGTPLRMTPVAVRRSPLATVPP